MFKLIIVDDFRIERESVKEILAGSGLELEVCGEFSNGKDAWQEMGKIKPDFILTDVEMPYMNGLELAERVKKTYPDVKLIIFSLYDRFEYAKAAIRSDAYAYILKPIVESELIDTFRSLIDKRKIEVQKIKEDHENRAMLETSKPFLNNEFKRCLFLGLHQDVDRIQEQLTFLKLPELRTYKIALSLEIDDYSNLMRGSSFEMKELFALRINKYIGTVLEQFPEYLWVRMDESHWAFLLNDREGNDENIKRKAYFGAVSMLQHLTENEVSASIGISSVFTDMMSISRMYQQATGLLDYKFHMGKNQIILFDDIQDASLTSEIQTNEIQKELVHALNQRDPSANEAYVDLLFSRIAPHASERESKYLCFSVVLHAQIYLSSFDMNYEIVFGNENIVWEKLLNYETIMDVRMWLVNILNAITEYIQIKLTSQVSRVVEDARKYIRKHYHQRISIKAIAEHLSYSPNYLNNIFKHETGETILEYITKTRIEEAKNLIIRDPGIRMYELAEAVGYSHDSYFRNIFYQVTGVTPKEFRDSLSG